MNILNNPHNLSYSSQSNLIGALEERIKDIKNENTKKKITFSLKAIGYYAAVTSISLAAFFAQVANASPADDYKSDRIKCLNGQGNQDIQTCLQEAGAAYQEKRARKLDGNSADYMDNSMARCDTFSGEDRVACRARRLGLGTSSGSVQGGGVITTIETVVPQGGPAAGQPQTAK